MNDEQGKPQFELASARSGASGPPEILRVDRNASASLDRRAFLGLGAGIPAVAALATFLSEKASAAEDILRAHRSAISQLFAAPDGETLVSGSNNTEPMKKWALQDGSRQKEDLADSSSGAWVTLNNASRIARAYSLKVTIMSFPGGEAMPGGFPSLLIGITAMAAGGDNSMLAITDGQGIQAGSLNGNSNSGVKRGQGTVTSIAINQAEVVSASADGEVYAWNPLTNRTRGAFLTGVPISCLVSLSGERTVITGHSSGAINLVSLSDGKLVELSKMPSDVRAIVFAAPADSIAAGAADGTIYALSSLNGERAASTTLHLASGAKLTTLTFVPVRNLLAAGTSDGRIALMAWPSLEFRSWLLDPSVTPSDSKGVSYRILDPLTGRTVTYTMPCGSPIPSGATCVCNCVPGIGAPTFPTPVPVRPSVPTTVAGPSLTQPCTATPIPPGFICTCNCI